MADGFGEPAAVTASGLKLNYGVTQVLTGVDFSVHRGETLALLGPSGCGKSTLLRLVAGLLAPTAGSIHIGGRLVSDAATGRQVPPERRGLGMVFQDYALWPHMSVAGNVAFPLEMRGIARAERERRAFAALERVGLAGYGGRNPGQLSGGQQQRVAIARAIVAEPDIVLFDEPLSNLDRELRESMVGEIGTLCASLGLTGLYVTHDQAEAFTLAGRVAVMRSGAIVQLDAPETLVGAPADRGVAEFLRLGTVAKVSRRDGHWWLDEAGLPFLAVASSQAPADSGSVLLGRHAVSFIDPSSAGVIARVVRSQFRGDCHLIETRIGKGDGLALTLTLEHSRRLPPGETVGLAIEPRRLRWFAAQAATQTQENA
jgi:iron(III) transport system ATP-binding protein